MKGILEGAAETPHKLSRFMWSSRWSANDFLRFRKLQRLHIPILDDHVSDTAFHLPTSLIYNAYLFPRISPSLNCRTRSRPVRNFSRGIQDFWLPGRSNKQANRPRLSMESLMTIAESKLSFADEIFLTMRSPINFRGVARLVEI